MIQLQPKKTQTNWKNYGEIQNGKIVEWKSHWLTPRTPKFYTSPKTHEQDKPGGLVVS